MSNHYSRPGGFVGRNICYLIIANDIYYGSMVGGSSTLHLAGRDEFFNIKSDNKKSLLRRIVNNVFYHIEKREGVYPVRNFAQLALKLFREAVIIDWLNKYGDSVLGFESLVELPRSGEVYIRDKWTQVGVTKGNTCKRVSGKTGKRTDSWTGRRVWDTENLRPKLVFVKKALENVPDPS